MDPHEQRLRDEVIYLHNLWHQGPPGNPNPNLNHRPISKSSRTLHKTSTPTTFKTNATKKHKLDHKKPKKSQKPPESNQETPPSGVEWPVQATPDQPSGWSKSLSGPATRPATAEEIAKINALQMQEKGLAACREFFSTNESDDAEEEEDVDDEDVEEDGCQEFEFFVGLFTKDGELRTYYEKNNEGGVFCCLVCGGTGKKIGKRYKDCVGLVQHSIAVSRTKKKRAHRAYGRVICRVLGWDVDRLPTIVIKSNPNGNADHLNTNADDLSAVIKNQNIDTDKMKGNPEGNADCLNDVVKDSNIDKDSNVDVDQLKDNPEGNADDLNDVVEGSIVDEDELKKNSLEVNGSEQLEDLDKGLSDVKDVNAGEQDCLVPMKEDGDEPANKDFQ